MDAEYPGCDECGHPYPGHNAHCSVSIKNRNREIDRLKDIVATLRQETEGFREVVIAKHGQIERLEARVVAFLQETKSLRRGIITKHGQIFSLEARNVRLVEALKKIAAPLEGVPAGNPWNFYLDLQEVASEAIAAEEKEQSK